MPARSSVAKATHAAPLHRLATNGDEKCGLARIILLYELIAWFYDSVPARLAQAVTC